ncbi:MAG TPA: LCP family protein, partial [Microthrixaceae bacterium]|nr:LCP family protein [Microthrixaceae bacterium]
MAVLAIAVILGGGAAWGFWSFARIDRVDVNLAEVEAPSKPINVLVVGSDSRAKVTSSDPGAKGMIGKGSPGGQRSDSLMIARIDQKSDRIDLLSIPRDLWVPISGTSKEQRINTAYSRSAQTVVDTIQDNLNIPIHHFVEVDFGGFRSLIDALDGVPMYFSHPVRDKHSGLTIPERGCHVLDGEQGLAFARSRHLEWKDGSKWVSDPSSDYGRMTRQQVLTRAALEKAQTLGLNNVRKLKALVDAAIGSVRLDGKWGASDLISMGRQLSNFDPERLQTHSLPTTGKKTSGGALVEYLNEEEAIPVLDIFRGVTSAPPVTTTTVPPVGPSDVTVDVVNASAPKGEGRRVSYVLSDGGFNISGVGNGTAAQERSTITYGNGQKDLAKLVAGWISPAPKLVEDKSLPVGKVVVSLGSDFEHVAKPENLPASGAHVSPPKGSGSESAGSSASTGSTDGQPSEAAPTATTTTTTTQPGWTPGVAPRGTSLNSSVFYYNYTGYQISEIVDRTAINLNFD